MIYTHQKSKLSKKQRAAREKLLMEQRAIKKDLQQTQSEGLCFSDPVPYRRPSVHIPSLGTGIGNAPLKPQMEYTGSAVVGISVIHKSCLQPVFSQQEAVDAAGMRR